MTIESNPFGGVRLTGDDARAFRSQFLGEPLMLTEDQVRQRLREFVGDRRQCDVARELGVSPPWLSLLLSGRKRPAGKVLDALGLARNSNANALQKGACLPLYREVG